MGDPANRSELCKPTAVPRMGCRAARGGLARTMRAGLCRERSPEKREDLARLGLLAQGFTGLTALLQKNASVIKTRRCKA